MTYSSVVEEIVGTRKLLEHLQHDAQQNPVRHPRGLEHAHHLADGVRLGRLLLGAHLALQLFHLHKDGIMIIRCTIHARQRPLRVVDPPLTIYVSGRLAEGPDPEAQDERPQPTQTDDDAPRGGAAGLVGVGAVVEARGEKDAQGDEELVRAHERAADPRRRRLGLEHGHHEAERADAQPCHQPAQHELHPRRRRRDLDDEADGHDAARQADGRAATQGVGQGRAEQGAH